MFRLVKLAAYFLMGYVIYELFIGVSEGSGGVKPQMRTPNNRANDDDQSGGGRSPSGNSGPRQSTTRQPKAAVSLTGENGKDVPVRDTGGAERRERVGRGVVSH